MAHTMRGFNKSKLNPDLIMTSVDNLMPCKRIWIEEWRDYRLTPEDVKILSLADVIMTPSLLNEHEILHHLPNSLVLKADRAWPTLPVQSSEKKGFIYFEKVPEFTKMLVNEWNHALGQLTVVGSTTKLPDTVRHVSDMDSYEDVFTALSSSSCLIDFSPNNYYKSGIVDLAARLGLNVITNNYLGMKTYEKLISFDAVNQSVPGIYVIESAIHRLSHQLTESPAINNRYVDDCLNRMLKDNA